MTTPHKDDTLSTFEDALSLLQISTQRLEFDHGEISAMAGSSANHAAISFNMCQAADEARGDASACRAHVANRVVTLQDHLTVMPDVVMTCEQFRVRPFFLNPHVSWSKPSRRAPGHEIARISYCCTGRRRPSTTLHLSVSISSTSRSSLAWRPIGSIRHMEQEKRASSASHSHHPGR